MPDSDFTRRGFLAAAGATLIASAADSLGQATTQLAPPDKQPADLEIPPPPGKKVGYALVGLGQLCVEEVLPAFAQCARSMPTALVSGHPDKAKKLAEHYGIDPKNIYTYEKFDQIRENPAVEVVYVMLPNSMHADFSIRALKAGKHVLCEKPMAVTSDECRGMIAAANAADRKLMVAYRLRYEPFNQSVIEMAQKQVFGKISHLEAVNAQNTQAPNIRLSKPLGGGPVGDVGVYCINAARYILNEEPVEVMAQAHQPQDDPRFAEVPASVTFLLKFPSGVLAHCGCSFASAVSRRYRVHCEKGWIDLDPAFAYIGLKLRTFDGQRETTHKLPQVNHFASEMDHLSGCVRDNQPVRTPGEEGLRDTLVMEAVYESIATGKLAKVASADQPDTLPSPPGGL